MAGPLRAQSMLTFRDLWVRARSIRKIHDNQAINENCAILHNGQYVPFEECTKLTHVMAELGALIEARDQSVFYGDGLAALVAKLKSINE